MTDPAPIPAPPPPPSLSAKLASWGGRSGALTALCMLAGSFMTAGLWAGAWVCITGVGILLAWSLWNTIRDHRGWARADDALWQRMANGQ